MSTVKEVTLIETSLTGAGRGTPDSPGRLLTQYWTKDGQLVFEIDPAATTVAPEDTEDLKQIIMKCFDDRDPLEICEDVVGAVHNYLFNRPKFQ